jgi:hypothetical protein
MFSQGSSLTLSPSLAIFFTNASCALVRCSIAASWAAAAAAAAAARSRPSALAAEAAVAIRGDARRGGAGLPPERLPGGARSGRGGAGCGEGGGS